MTQSVMFHRVNSAPRKSLFERMSDLEREKLAFVPRHRQQRTRKRMSFLRRMRRTNEVLSSSLLAELVRGVVDVIRFFYMPPGGEGQMSWSENKRKQVGKSCPAAANLCADSLSVSLVFRTALEGLIFFLISSRTSSLDVNQPADFWLCTCGWRKTLLTPASTTPGVTLIGQFHLVTSKFII